MDPSTTSTRPALLASDGIWTLGCLSAAIALTRWIWQAAGDIRVLESEADRPLLQAIAGHRAAVERSSPSDGN